MNVISVTLLQPSECHFVYMEATIKLASLHGGSISTLVKRSTLVCYQSRR